MKQLILNYLKRYMLDIDPIINNSHALGKAFLTDPNDKWKDKHKMSYIIDTDSHESNITFSCGKEQVDDIIKEFCDGLVKLIEDNSEIEVQYTKFNNGKWFGWRDYESEIHFGIKNEEFRFEARFSLKNNNPD